VDVVPLYAHRLGRAYGPDNSASALAGALAAGVEGLETDLCLSADGELVLLHDPWLPLTTRLEGFAHQRSGKELRGAGLLALEDLLAAAPRALTLQLEVKAHADPMLAVRTVDVLAARLRAARGRRVEVLSFNAVACERAASLGLPARLVIWADYAPAALVRWARGRDVLGVCMEHFLLSAPFVAALRRGGLSVTTGTVNDPALLARVLRFAPDAVTTDAPHALRGVHRDRAVGGSGCGGRTIRPDRKLVAGRVGEMEPAAAGERVDRLENRPAGRGDRTGAALEVLGVEDHQRTPGPHLGIASQTAHFPAVALDAGVVGAVVDE
jgi:glycerophosphoryl diester phosphodiesterase